MIREARPLAEGLGRRTSHLAAALSLVLACPAARAAPADANAAMTVTFGIGPDVFREVNNNDAAVAVATYSKTVGEDYGVKVRVVIFDTAQAVSDALKRKEVDLINVTPTQFLEIDRGDVEGPLLVSTTGAGPFERYVLLVRADAPMREVRDLRGRTLVRSDDLRSSMAGVWLDVLLRQHGLGSAKALGRVTVATKPAQAVLPVFFGKYDACVATRRAWEVMGEMNPQVKMQLRPIAESPPLVSGMAVFRKGIPEAMKQGILAVVGNSDKKPSFQQLLTLFKITNVSVQPASALDSTLELLATYRPGAVADLRSKAMVLRAHPPPARHPGP